MSAYSRVIYGEPFLAAHLHNQDSINLAENDGEVWKRPRLTAPNRNKCSKYSCRHETESSLQRRMEMPFRGRWMVTSSKHVTISIYLSSSLRDGSEDWSKHLREAVSVKSVRIYNNEACAKAYYPNNENSRHQKHPSM